ncbi:MAG TPA: PQQ-binding-like beta-propeller repeat protein [Candidatus Paceibacterota bacterium]|jgi:outer membrane protein assembly factor BamB/orotate phosphoribosyltransferase|nr:PQQ-binding-like beta-propeller repeat protein [Candidatus Paceibacterota bacterium]
MIQSDQELLEKLRAEIIERAFATNENRHIISPRGVDMTWIFDFRPILLSKTLDTICELFWRRLQGEGSFQVGGLETAAIALVAGMAMKGREKGGDLHGFYIRKSRRKDGFQKGIEGDVGQEPIILLDDAMNSGKSIMRQIKALEAEGKKVRAVCVIIRFRDVSFYEEFAKRGIKIISLFTLDDFPASEGMKVFAVRSRPMIAPPKDGFDIEWQFASDHPSYFRILPKSAPAIDETRLYFGADNGILWALNQFDGSVAWKFRTLYGTGDKRIFSSPAVWNCTVYFGAYDGNFYALDASTGKKKWVYLEADWIGSSPVVAEDLGTVFVGLEFGLWKKKGGITALDAKTGEKKWWHEMETYVHSTPGYSRKSGIVVVGSTEGNVYAFEARNGKPLWTYKTEGAVRAGFAFDEKRGIVCFGSEDKYMYALKIKNGELVHKIETLEPIYSTPLVHEGTLYFGVLDKRMFSVDLDTGAVNWKFWTMSRIFSTPVIADGRLYFGSNDGRLYELDPKTGAETSYFQTTERIVNKIAYNSGTKRLFVPTYANEIYCLTRHE